MRILVSGASSGLGAYLTVKYHAETFNRISYKRNYKHNSYDKIIHCAFGMPNTQNEEDYIQSHLSICSNLLDIPHKHFIFISSIEVLQANNTLSLYAKAKRQVEKMILESSDKALIIRPGSLFGPGMRINQILRVALGDQEKLTLSAESNFAIVMYEDLFHVINSGALGTYHLTSARTVTLNEIAKKFSTNPNWGNYRYFTPEIKCDLCLEKIYDLKEIDPIERLSSFITKHNFLISYKQ